MCQDILHDKLPEAINNEHNNFMFSEYVGKHFGMRSKQIILQYVFIFIQIKIRHKV